MGGADWRCEGASVRLSKASISSGVMMMASMAHKVDGAGMGRSARGHLPQATAGNVIAESE